MPLLNVCVTRHVLPYIVLTFRPDRWVSLRDTRLARKLTGPPPLRRRLRLLVLRVHPPTDSDHVPPTLPRDARPQGGAGVHSAGDAYA